MNDLVFFGLLWVEEYLIDVSVGRNPRSIFQLFSCNGVFVISISLITSLLFCYDLISIKIRR